LTRNHFSLTKHKFIVFTKYKKIKKIFSQTNVDLIVKNKIKIKIDLAMCLYLNRGSVSCCSSCELYNSTRLLSHVLDIKWENPCRALEFSAPSVSSRLNQISRETNAKQDRATTLESENKQSEDV
jgi:hypothetical protein